MRNRILLSTVMMALIGLVILSCKTQSDIAGHYNYDSECIAVDLDGSQILKVWGTGRTREHAIEMAKKNGIRDVLFKGIRNGKPDCNVKPVIPEVNAQEKYEDYFNKFFAEDGIYKNYVSIPKGSLFTTNEVEYKGTNKSTKVFSIIVNIHRSDLKAKMIQDNILKP